MGGRCSANPGSGALRAWRVVVAEAVRAAVARAGLGARAVMGPEIQARRGRAESQGPRRSLCPRRMAEG